MKTYWAVGIATLILAYAALLFCATSLGGWVPCTDATAWCSKWTAELSSQQLANFRIGGLVSVVVVLTILPAYGRSMRGNAFNVGPKITHRYENSKPMLAALLGLFYTVELLAWGHLNSPAVLLACFIGFFSILFFVGSVCNLMRWLALETKGMEWGTTASGGNALFRVIYRRADGATVVDLATHADRSVEELNYGRQQRPAAIASVVALVIAIVGRPIAYQSSEYLGWALTYLVMAPLLAKVGTDLIYTLAYRTGAQFIPGAKVLDLPPDRINPSQLDTEAPHGDASFETAADMVRRMRGKART
jgi:hypothetical protein